MGIFNNEFPLLNSDNAISSLHLSSAQPILNHKSSEAKHLSYFLVSDKFYIRGERRSNSESIIKLKQLNQSQSL